MKKILSIIIMCAMCMGASAQTEASQQFLKRFSLLVDRVKEEYADNTDSVTTWKAEHQVFREMYKARYRSAFTDDELEQYIKLNTQYKTKMAKLHLGNFGNEFGRKMNRFGKKVSGFLDGMNEKSEKNRTEE